MTPRTSSPFPIWVATLALSLGFLVWINGPRWERIERVTAVAESAVLASASSPTGYEHGTRELIVPKNLSTAQESIVLTQEMLAEGRWRVRHFEGDNAPFGREVRSASLYRWWLGLVAWTHHFVKAQPLGLSVERAALIADPLLLAAWLIVSSLLAARVLGTFGALVIAGGGALIYPFAAGFSPGVPEDHALSLVLGTLSVLFLLKRSSPTSRSADAAPSTRKGKRRGAAPAPAAPTRYPRRWFIAGGVAGGLGLWNAPQVQIPILVAIAVGGAIAAWLARRAPSVDSEARSARPPWRSWAVAGSATVMGGWLVEYFPGYITTSTLQSVHAMHAVAWLGGGELLVRLDAFLAHREVPKTSRTIALTGVAALACASYALVAIFTDQPLFPATDILAFHFTKQITAPVVPNLISWFAAAGFDLRALTAVIPVLGAVFAVVQMLRAGLPEIHRERLALATAPALASAFLGYFHVRWWQMAGGLGLLVAAASVAAAWAPSVSRFWRRAWTGYALALAVLGAYQQLPSVFLPGPKELSVPEAEAVVGRHLAQWLARRSAVPQGAVVFAPPSVSSTLGFHARLRGVTSFSSENQDGLRAAIRIAISTSRDETHALCQNREIRYLVLPSWDSYFDPYVQSASVQVGTLFLPSLQKWALPPWLRPIPYAMPKIPGFEKHMVAVFELVEEQDEPLALSRLTEYFIEMAQPQNAQIAGESLRRFPADFGALVTRAQLESALGDQEAFATTMDTVLKRMANGADHFLPFDRRVSLATALARAQRFEEAKTQVQRCLANVDNAAIRSLTPFTLYHLLGLCRGFGFPIADPDLRELALDLLPEELRRDLESGR